MKVKLSAILTLATMLIGSGTLLAAENMQEHTSHHPKSAEKAMPAKTGAEMPMSKIHMAEMHSQMDSIREAKDSNERNKLINDHMDSMQKMMAMMQDMHSGNAPMDKGMTMPCGKMDGSKMTSDNLKNSG